MFRYLFVLFIAMPIVEIAVLIQVGSSIGLLSTLAIIIATAVLGTMMLRQQGMATLARAQERLASGEMPAQQLMEGMILLVGGVLLLTPGFVTDAIGFFCLIPVTRQWLAAKIAKRSVVGAWSMAHGSSDTAAENSADTEAAFKPSAAAPQDRPRAGSRHTSSSGDVIEGTYRREDDQ